TSTNHKKWGRSLGKFANTDESGGMVDAGQIFTGSNLLVAEPSHHLEGGTKSAPALNTLKLLGTAPAYVYRWGIHPYIVQPVVAFEHKPCLPVLSHQRSRFLIALVESGCP
ncbi:hypothetical protein Tsp_04964, partial [Trichinella spiralis]|uniref:hypothetical protein n=1 Tax=Trichinella spiralis TaxID=6334 RepID=UPI0001EFE760